jgi:hypothetical protein
MLVASSPEKTAALATAEPVHQLYVTHCLYDEGVTRQAGFTVRATSTRDPLLLRFAQDYPHYELPAGLQPTDDLSAPRRLALVRIPGGPKALIHSVPLLGARHGRTNNFFSHVLIGSSLEPRDVLRLWASADWATGCPPSAGKDLDPVESALEPGPVSDQALTDYLQPDVQLGDFALGSLIVPERLANDVERRRQLLVLALRGCLMVLQAAPGSARSRFFLQAEPGLTALLLYGAVRLLPPNLAAEVTFSTYEDMRHTLRTFRHAQVVGTWSGQQGQALEDDFFTTKGYALDTFQMRCSPELLEDRHPAIEQWVELATQGDWKLLDTVYRFLGNTGSAVVSFHEGFQAARLAQRLTKGKADSSELLALKRSPWGAPLLEQHQEKLWPLVREASLTDPAVQEAFADVLAGRLPELEQKVTEALKSTPPGDWQSSWRLLQIILKGDPSKLRDTLQRILPPPPYTPEQRFAILPELRGLELFPLQQQLPLHGLLRQCTVEDLERFARSELPRPWYVWALCYAVLRAETQAHAAGRLQGGDDELLRVFWEQFKLLKDEGQRRAILTPLLTTGRGKSVLFFGRSLRVMVSLRLDTLEWMLETLGALGKEWVEFWCAEDHLVQLMDVLRGLGDDSQRIHDRLCGYFDPNLLLLGDPFQRTLLVHLAAARNRPGLMLPDKAAGTIDDLVLLREHFDRACAVPQSDRVGIIAACQRRGIDVIAVLKRYFEQYVLPHEMNEEIIDDFAGFFDSFYPSGESYQEAASRQLGWNEIVSICPEEQRGQAYRRYYLEHFVSKELRDRIAEEVLQDVRPAGGHVSSVRPPRLGPDAPVLETRSVVAGNELFQMAGVRGGGAESMGRTLVRGAPWQLAGFAGGLLAVVLFGAIKVPPRQVAVVCSFLPLVLALAEAMATLAVATKVGSQGDPKAFRRGLAFGLLAGVGLAAVLGGIALVAALVLGTAWDNAVAVAVAVAAGTAVAALVGLTLPVLLDRPGKRPHLAAGPIARALAGTAALALYLLASSWLLR